MFFTLYAENQITKKELNSAIKELSLQQKPEFPLRGKDIKDLGYSGVEIGVVLSALKKM